MKRLLKVLILLSLTTQVSFAKTYQPVPSTVKLPAKYTQEYIDSISDEYKNVSDEQIFHVALDMLKGTSGDFSRKAILGYNVTQYPVKVMFKDLSEINEAYSTFDAIGWKKKGKLYIYINPKHEYAPPGAIAALLAHEAIHQDEYNSLSEETYAWTMEAVVWTEILKMFPESNNLESALVTRENILKQLLEKGNHTNKYIKKTVYANEGYKNLPLTSPGFSNQ
ncbi:TPA: hypothetical protein CPT90_04310 [Candidatus Gastranaerophilales bacterium HUM_3]|jgi:hypothetical protein|nr:hypothetical protein [Acinetobacter sp.]CCZ50198.1 unknown [Acinetobacter sp. CAG:196]DAA84736.1 MAG TPA: hypothetical protein CPT90_04310 [Candidatus Gastranaerophilales bacterium HUM_3]DAB02572.1 MAG TPA: hypothetical protein CPT96_02250 [Candidatus Gastranaerophilales bacterium HUM_10]DAB13447.1 MAG TPA: hypothetical protein CPT91_00755 [Candidatus Gastranaerophilales bacterium HUM_16]DAB16639.1 MAG TPA: hypothetical protein CPT98_07415 [Candidatus Gastranaerophilales bacterium HUM_19]D